MSSSEASDEEFESADEDIESEESPQSSHRFDQRLKDLKIDNKVNDSVDENKQRIDSSQIKDNKSHELIPNEETKHLSQKAEKECEESIVESIVDTKSDSIGSEKCEDNDNESQRTETEFKSKDLKIDETVVENEVNESESKEQKTIIKGRKLLRKVDRIREQTTSEESELSEQKKTEILNKLSDLSETNTSSKKWNNWLTDIKSAAMTATSTTVSHMSQASNKWSFDPKSLLSSAATITTSVGTGISSVVENVGSVVDSAIGAPPPEQMAALVTENQKVKTDEEVDNRPESDVNPNVVTNESSSKSGFGFGLFDYTLNRLETIGKKTMEVMTEDDNRSDERK